VVGADAGGVWWGEWVGGGDDMKPLFVEISEFLQAEQAIRKRLAHDAPLIIRSAMDDGVSLRQLANRSGLSPTYLSAVLNKKSVISFGGYLKLIGALEQP
jgi:AraC-like DNA-binding protein